MKSKLQKVLSNYKIRVFLFFLAISLGSLFLNKLSKEYKDTIQFDIIVDNIPSDKILLKTPETNIRLFVKASGFNLIGYKILSKKIKINAATATFISGTTYKIDTNRLIGEFHNQLFSDTEIIEILDKSIFIELGKIVSKKIPVLLKSNITYEKGYKIKGSIKLLPDSITVYGPEDKVAEINKIETKRLILNNIYTSFEEEINLKITDDLKRVSISENKINVSADVEKFTELSFMIPYKIINNHQGFNIETFPSKVKLVFQVELSEIPNINEESFVVVCDFENTIQNKLSYLVPKVIEKPKSIYNYYIEPSKVDYIIKN
ncbi:MAG: YbbR-like domain-containing protein [Flavobacteriaceae bacterium]|nr:YbbR-like domain-containing protein [Flavobacteriaceae bacterium]